MHFLRQLIKRVIHHRRPVMVMWWSLYLPSPLTSFSVALTLSLSLWFHRKSIGHKKAVALTLTRLWYRFWFWIWFCMLHAYYCWLRVVLSSLALFALTFLSLPTLKQTCEPHTHMCTFIIAHFVTHTHSYSHIKTEWNWETCQHFRLGFYVCLSFFVISTHLNDNKNNNNNTRVPLLFVEGDGGSPKWEIRYAIRFCWTVCIRLAMAKAYKHIHTANTRGLTFWTEILC